MDVHDDGNGNASANEPVDDNSENEDSTCAARHSSICRLNIKVGTDLSKLTPDGLQDRPSTSANAFSFPVSDKNLQPADSPDAALEAQSTAKVNVAESSSRPDEIGQDEPQGQKSGLKSPCSSVAIKSQGTESRTEDSLQFIIDENISFGSRANHDFALRLSTDSTSRCDFCRICHDSDLEERLISPCNCKGTLSLVHTSCLQHWLAESVSSSCELCGFKYTLVGSMFAWFRVCRRQRRELVLDILATISFAPMAGIGTYVCLLMAEALNLDEDLPNLTIGTLLARVGSLSVISLMTTFDVAYFTWAVIRLQYHYNSWYNWYRRNSEVTVITPIEQNQ